MSEIAITQRTDLSYAEAIAACRAALADEGFGVLTEIDIAATLKNKLDVDREPYTILGACHAPSAHQALGAAPEVGVLLPCNVTVSVEEGTTVLRAMDPAGAMAVIDDPVVAAMASDIRARLVRVLDAVG